MYAADAWMKARLPVWTLVTWCCLMGHFVGWGQTNFSMHIDKEKVYQGASFEVEYKYSDVGGGQLIPPQFEDFKVLAGPMIGQQMTIINGVREQSVSYRYTLQAPQAGTYVIPPASIRVDGRVLTSNQRTIQVLPPLSLEDLSLPNIDDARPFIVRAELSDDTVYLGQQLTLDYYIYMRRGQAFGRTKVVQDPGLTGSNFYATVPDMQDAEPVMADGKSYLRCRVRRYSIFPKEQGAYAWGPAVVQVMVPNGTRSFFGRNYDVTTLQTNGVSVFVKELPKPTPNNYSGVVGRYQAAYNYELDPITTDDAITIEFRVQGDGNADYFELPTFSHDPELEPYEPTISASNSVKVQSRIQHYVEAAYIYTASSTGPRWVYPQFIYFDVDSADFVTITPGKLTYQVALGSQSSRKADTLTSTYVPFDRPPREAKLWSSSIWGRGLWLILLLVSAVLGFKIWRSSKHIAVELSWQEQIRQEILTLSNQDTSAIAKLRQYVLDYGRLRGHGAAHSWDAKAMYAQLEQMEWSSTRLSDFEHFMQRTERAAYAGGMLGSFEELRDQALSFLDKLEDE